MVALLEATAAVAAKQKADLAAACDEAAHGLEVQRQRDVVLETEGEQI